MAVAVQLLLYPPALLADESSAGSSGSMFRLLPDDSQAAPVQSTPVRQEPRAAAHSEPGDPRRHLLRPDAASKPLFSRTKWQGPAGVVPQGPEMRWKGAFPPRGPGRRNPILA